MAQNESDFELIVVDGGSKDQTLSIVSMYLRPSDTLISEPDNGIYDAMNKGINVSKGEFIYFIGADDLLFNVSTLQNVSDLIRPDDEFIYGDVIFNSTGLRYNGEFDLYKIMRYNICHQACFYKRELFQKLGVFEVEYKLFADYLFNVKCFTSKVKCRYLNVNICYYNDMGSSFNEKDQSFVKLKKANWLKYFSPFFSKIEIIRGMNYRKERDGLKLVRNGRFFKGFLILVQLFFQTFDIYYLKNLLYWTKQRLIGGLNY